MLKGNKPNKVWKQQLYVEFGVSTEVPCTSDPVFQNEAQKFVADLRRREPHQFPNAAIAAMHAGVTGQTQQSAPIQGASMPAQSTFAGSMFAGPSFAGPSFAGPSHAGSSFAGLPMQPESTGLIPPNLLSFADNLATPLASVDPALLRATDDGLQGLDMPLLPSAAQFIVDPGHQSGAIFGDSVPPALDSANMAELEENAFDVNFHNTMFAAGFGLPASTTTSQDAQYSASTRLSPSPGGQDQEPALGRSAHDPVDGTPSGPVSSSTSSSHEGGSSKTYITGDLMDGNIDSIFPHDTSNGDIADLALEALKDKAVPPQDGSSATPAIDPAAEFDAAIASLESDPWTLQQQAEGVPNSFLEWQLDSFELEEPVSHTLSAQQT